MPETIEQKPRAWRRLKAWLVLPLAIALVGLGRFALWDSNAAAQFGWYREQSDGNPAVIEHHPHILILASYHEGFYWSDQEIKGVTSVLPEDVELYVEYMDTKRFLSDRYLNLLYDAYRYKYHDMAFDCVVVFDNNAFDFAIQHHGDLFPDTPIVFGGVNHFEMSMLQGDDLVTGIGETIDHEGTIDLILRLHPNTEQLLIITDNTTTGRTHRVYLERLADSGQFPAQFVFLDTGAGLDLPQLVEIVSSAPKNSVIYYSDFFVDKHGDPVRYEEALPILSQASTVPIYNTGDFYLGYGTVGGKLVSGFYEGQAVGEMVLRILAGESVSQIPIEFKSHTKYMFDYQQLKRWDIPLTALPEGSIVLNRPDSFYMRYKGLIWGTTTFVVVQAVIIGYLLVNIARRRRAEQALRENEERHRIISELTSDFASCTRVNPDNTVTIEWVTDAFTRVTGYSPTDRDFPDDFLANAIHPDDVPKVLTGVDECLDNQTIDDEYRIITKDGQVRWIHAHSQPVWDEEEGRVVRIYGAAKDITDRKRIEEERARLLVQIQQQAERVQQIIDTVPEGVILIDANGRVLLANPLGQEDLDTLAQASIGQTVGQLGNRPLEEVLGRHPQGLWHEVRADNRVFEVLARPLESGPEPGEWVIVVRDMTRERQIQRSIQRQERLAAVGQLAAGIAHDFNNILASILLYAQMMSRSKELDATNQERVETIDQQARHAARLVQQVLDFSRRAVLERQPLDLVPLLREAANLLRRTLPESIAVNFTYGPEDYVVNADPTRIQQILINLALNAQDAMEDKGRLCVSLHRLTIEEPGAAPLPDLKTGEWIQIVVSDTGRGIAPDILPHIYDPFFTTKEPGQGTGLGLAQVYGIVSQHEGHIDVESQLGQGTTFTIYLPALQMAKSEPATPEAYALTEGCGETILVVEDDAVTRAAVQESLTALGYCVVEVSDGQQAIKVLQETHDEIALILSDVVMPNMNGTKMLEALQERKIAQPVVIMTGHPLEDDLESLEAQGLIVDWISKPINLRQLSQVVSQAIQAAKGESDSAK